MSGPPFVYPVSGNIGPTPVSDTAPTNDQVPTFNGTEYVPQTPSAGGGTRVRTLSTITTDTTLVAADFTGYDMLVAFCSAAAGNVTLTLPLLSTLEATKQLWLVVLDVTHTFTLSVTGTGTVWAESGPLGIPASLPSKVSFFFLMPNTGSTAMRCTAPAA